MVAKNDSQYDISKTELQRCRSAVDLLRDAQPVLPNRLRSSLGLFTINRSASHPDLASCYNHDGYYLSSRFWPSRRHWGSGEKPSQRVPLDEYFWQERSSGGSPLFWPTTNWPHQRYGYYADKASSYWSVYPDLQHWPKYGRLATRASLDPVGWYRKGDPASATIAHIPWTVSTRDHGLSAHMYRRGLADYDAVERNWLAPYRFRRYLNQDATRPFERSTWLTSPRRYFYTFDSM